MKFVYVAGYGRSGSTALGRVLAAQTSGAIVVGEAGLVPLSVVSERVCACGARVSECAFWDGTLGDVVDDIGGAPAVLSKLMLGPLGLCAPMFVLRWAGRRLPYTPALPHKSMAGVVRHLEKLGTVPVLVDTSKTAYTSMGRPLMLAAAGALVELHLPRRSTADVVRSYRVAHARRGHPVGLGMAHLRVRIGVMVAHAAARLMAWRLRSTLVTHQFSETLLESRHIKSDTESNHIVAGNRMRHLPMSE